MEQKITTAFQSKWLSKLMGYDYEVCYKKGKENVVADGLSRVPATHLFTLATSSVQATLLEDIRQSWEQDSGIQEILNKLKDGKDVPKYTYSQGVLYRSGKMVVGEGVGLHNQIMQFFHASSLGGHFGVAVTTKRIEGLFWWKGLRKEVRNYVRECQVCQKYKVDLSAPQGLLQPLPIPGAIWVDISLDFIEGLPKSRGKDTILVVVDRLSKYAHFLPLSHPFSAVTVAQLYFDNIFKLHGIRKTMVSDRGKVFINQFWQELFRLHHTALHLFTAYHPQSDG